MEIQSVLEQAGLNQKQANVYLAALELGTASVQTIARKAELKRPTTYLILDELQHKGFVSIVPQKKILYTAESPERLVVELGKKQDLLKRFLPDLLALHNGKKEKPQVQLFQGKEGVAEVYAQAWRYQTLDIFCTLSDVNKYFPELPKELKRKSEAGQMKVREMVTQSQEDLSHAKWMEQTNNYQIRHAPANMQFLTDNIIFGNSVAFFSYQPYLFAVLITSEGIATSLKTLFELAWSAAELPA